MISSINHVCDLMVRMVVIWSGLVYLEVRRDHEVFELWIRSGYSRCWLVISGLVFVSMSGRVFIAKN